MGEERRYGSAEAPNFGAPAEPRPAASVVLLRQGGERSAPALEVLMLRRSEAARFMPGVWVFPGGGVDPRDGEGESGRRACARRELGEEAGIELPADAELVPFARWITPEVISTRFDAWFFLALAPPQAPPRPDGGETTEAAWLQPGAALAAEAAGELALAFPTVRQLGALAAFGGAEEALAAHRDRPLEPILPKVLADGDGHRVVLPGDPGYPA